MKSGLCKEVIFIKGALAIFEVYRGGLKNWPLNKDFTLGYIYMTI